MLSQVPTSLHMHLLELLAPSANMPDNVCIYRVLVPLLALNAFAVLRTMFMSSPFLLSPVRPASYSQSCGSHQREEREGPAQDHTATMWQSGHRSGLVAVLLCGPLFFSELRLGDDPISALPEHLLGLTSKAR